MFKKLIEIKRFEMENLLKETRELCRLQNCLESNTSVYMIREISCSHTNNVLAYLTGDYTAMYDEFEFEAFRQNIDFSENYVTKLSQDEVVSIADNLLNWDDIDEINEDELLDYEEEELC